MVTAQFTITATQSKWLIAHCVARTQIFQRAKTEGRILFKGSTTVSCLSQLMEGDPLRICGRITETGMNGSKTLSTGPHWLLYDQGVFRNVEDEVEELIKDFGSKDLFVCGANAIDVLGHSALLIGSPGGGAYGKALGALYTEGIRTLVLAVSDKLIPGDLSTLYASVSRKDCAYAYGMACGLAPVPGELLTEEKALMAAFPVAALIFSAGGMPNTEYISALQITGEPAVVEEILALVAQVRTQKDLMGEPASLTPCSFPSPDCGRHLSCAHAKKNTICVHDSKRR